MRDEQSYLLLTSCEIKFNQNSETSQQTLKEERHASTEIETQETDKEIRTKSDTSVTKQPLDKAPSDQTSISKSKNSGVKVKPATFPMVPHLC